MMLNHLIDYINLDSLFKEDELKLRDYVRAFVEKELNPIIDEHFANGTFPLEIVKELGKNKFIGSFIKGYSCAGYNPVKHGIICQEIERGDGGIRSFLTTQDTLSMFAIYKYGDERQKNKYLPKMAKGEIIGCFGLVEEKATSNPIQMTTTAIKDGNRWIINGKKKWITNATIADICIVWAKTNDGIKGFIVEMDSQGVEIEKINSNISLRSTITAGISFNDVSVKESCRLPFANGLKAPLSCLTEIRYGMAWGAIGAAVECYTLALNFAKEEILFGRPVASSQLVQRKLVNMLTEITKARAITIQVAKEKEKKNNFRHEMVAMIAYNNLTKALDIAREAKEIYGIHGITVESKIIRHLLNLESINSYEGINDIYILIVGRDITGFQAFF